MKPSKCKFALKHIFFLGYYISEEGVTPNPSKIKVIEDTLPFPNTEDQNPGKEINQNFETKELPNSGRKIINHRRFHQKLQYLLETNGPDLPPAWVSADELRGDPVVDYYLANNIRRPHTRMTTQKVLTVNVINVDNRHFSAFYDIKVVWLILLLFLTFLGTRSVFGTLDIGPLYNCGVTQYLGIYSLPTQYQCNRNFDENKLITYNASVRQYRPRETAFYIYHCEAQMTTLSCNTLFFGSKERSHSTRAITVAKRHCFIAFRTKVTPFGMLHPDGNNKWSTKKRKAYKCKWEQEEKTSFASFSVHRYKVSVIGADKIIHQHITGTNCDVRAHFCTPQEMPLSILVWGKPAHDYSLFSTLGVFEIYQIHNYVLISRLGIGGGVIRKTGELTLLDNGYILRRIISKKTSSTVPPDSDTAKFMNHSKAYVSQTTSNVQRDLSEGRIASEVIKENRMLTHMASILCNTNHKVHEIQRLLLKEFPDIDHSALFGQGKMVEMAGDAMLVHSCQKIESYEIFWNQTWNGSCYHLLPVVSNAVLPIGFLELATRRVVRKSHIIHCIERSPRIYVNNSNNKYWEIKDGKPSRRVKPYAFNHPFKGLILPKLAGFNNKLLHYTKTRPHRLTLLHMLAAQRENLDDMAKFRTEGAGNLASGLAQALSGTLSFVAKTGRIIFKTLTNSTEELIDVSAEGLSNVLQSLGTGLHTAILYFLTICIIVYLTCKHFGILPVRAILNSPPPIPPRQREIPDSFTPQH